MLAEWGFITITPRNNGFSVQKSSVPDDGTEPEVYQLFKDILWEKLRMDVVTYDQLLMPPPPVRHRSDGATRGLHVDERPQHEVKPEHRDDLFDDAALGAPSFFRHQIMNTQGKHLCPQMCTCATASPVPQLSGLVHFLQQRIL